MTVIETSRRLGRAERKVLRLQRRLWFAQRAIWRTAIVLAVLLVGGVLWAACARLNCSTRGAGAGSAESGAHLVAAFGVGEVVAPEFGGGIAHKGCDQRRHPGGAREAGPVRMRDGGFQDGGARTAVGA